MKPWQSLALGAFTAMGSFGGVALVVLAFLRYGYLVAWIVAAAILLPMGLLTVSRWPGQRWPPPGD